MQTSLIDSPAYAYGYAMDEQASLAEAMTHCVSLEDSRRSVLEMVHNYFHPKA